MEKQTNNKKEVVKTIIIALAAITTCTLLFSVFADGVENTEMQKTEMVSTNYNTPATAVASVSRKSLMPEGYEKANYSVVPDLAHGSDIPTAKDITPEEAAEIGAQGIWQILEKDLDDTTIHMKYNAGTVGNPRGSWYGDVKLNSELLCSFNVDSITGDLTRVYSVRSDDINPEDYPISPENLRKYENGQVTKEELPFLPDHSLDKDATEYEILAKQMAEKSNIIGEIESIGNKTDYCISQGGFGPEISIDIPVQGINGKIAIFCFSRYDKKFLAVRIDQQVDADLKKQADQQKKLLGIDK